MASQRSCHVGLVHQNRLHTQLEQSFAFTCPKIRAKSFRFNKTSVPLKVTGPTSLVKLPNREHIAQKLRNVPHNRQHTFLHPTWCHHGHHDITWNRVLVLRDAKFTEDALNSGRRSYSTIEVVIEGGEVEDQDSSQTNETDHESKEAVQEQVFLYLAAKRIVRPTNPECGL